MTFDKNETNLLLSDVEGRKVQPLVYTTWRQEPTSIGGMSFAVRAAGNPALLVESIRQVVRQLDANLPVTDVITQVERTRKTIAGERFSVQLLTFFGALASLLVAIGLYGVMAYAVAQRTAEIGIRMALGAEGRTVLRMIFVQGLKFVAIGVVLGGLAAQLLERVVKSTLYGVSAGDPITLVLVVGALLAVCLVALWIPARRATRVDPMVALPSD